MKIFIFLLLLSNRTYAEWKDLIKDKTIKDFPIHFNQEKLNTNYKETFQLKNNVLKLDYTKYSEFEMKLGYLFFPRPYGKFHLKFEYRFVGSVLKNTPDWAYRNSGIMYFSQSAESMQDFQMAPSSFEFVLLAEQPDKKRTTANLCTPGTKAIVSGSEVDDCINSDAMALPSDQWVEAEIIVEDSKSIKHIINGKIVLTASNPTEDTTHKHYMRPNAVDGKLIKKGFIAIQAEGSELELRNFLIKELP